MVEIVNFMCILPQLKNMYQMVFSSGVSYTTVAPVVLKAENNFSSALWKLNCRLCTLTHFPSRKPILEVLTL